MNITEKTLAFLRDCYEQRVDTLLDDPDEVCENADELAAYVLSLVEIGDEIGTSFVSVAKANDRGTEHLIEVFDLYKQGQRRGRTTATPTEFDTVEKATNVLKELQ